MKAKKQVGTFVCAMFAGGSEDLLKLDLSFRNVAFYKLGSPEFQAKLRGINKRAARSKENLKFFKEKLENFHASMRDSLYVLLPIDLSVPNRIHDIAEIRASLLIMFPADFRDIATIVFGRGIDGHFMRHYTASSTYKMNDLRKGKAKRINFGATNPEDASNFIRNFIDKGNTHRYLSIAIQSYYNSFFQDEMRPCYTTLFIALESVTAAITEITHQMSRYCAVLNSATKEEGRLIYKKASALYGLRSKIVHGDHSVNPEMIKQYYFHLEMLTARTLVELLSHSFTTKEGLKDKINEYGFGEKHLLSENYIHFHIIPDNLHLLLDALPVVPKKKPEKPTPLRKKENNTKT